MGTATTHEKIMVMKASRNEKPRRDQISSETGRPYSKDMPKSPCNRMPAIHL